MSTVFGPVYARWPALQDAVNHAEKARTLLERMTTECLEARGPELAVLSETETWLLGRPLEIEIIVGHWLGAWRRGFHSEDEVAAAIEHYLGERVHAPLVNERGPHLLECCWGEEGMATTAVALETAPTLVATLPASGPEAEREPTLELCLGNTQFTITREPNEGIEHAGEQSVESPRDSRGPRNRSRR